MAYISALWLMCNHPGCAKKATDKVMNRYNAEIGKFCQLHATQKWKEIERYEQYEQGEAKP